MVYEVNSVMNIKDKNGNNNTIYPVTKKENVIGLPESLNELSESISSASSAVSALAGTVAGKVDKIPGKGLSTNDFTDKYKANLDSLDTALEAKADASDLTATQNQLNSLNDEISALSTTVAGKASTSDVTSLATTVGGKADTIYVNTELAKKVNKETGKGLSTNDYTTAEKNKLAGIAEGANKTTVDSALSSTSTNPVQNKAVNTALSSKLETSTFNSYKTSNDTAVRNKADKTYVDNELAKKADSSALTSKADASTVSALSETVATKADSSTVSAISDRVSATETEQETLSARMDTFTKLSEGSTTGDAELADGRVGADGKTYDNIGGAIRGQVTDLKSDLSAIKITDSLIFNNGYINADGTINPNANSLNNHYTNFIDVSFYERVVVYPSSGFQTSIAYYDKFRNFIERTSNVTTPIEVTNAFYIRINVASLKSSSVDDEIIKTSINVSVQPISIDKSMYNTGDYFVSAGNPVTGVYNNTRVYALCSSIDGNLIKAKSGYQIGVYYKNNKAYEELIHGWNDEYITTRRYYKNLLVIVRKTDDSNFILTGNEKISDYVYGIFDTNFGEYKNIFDNIKKFLYLEDYNVIYGNIAIGDVTTKTRISARNFNIKSGFTVTAKSGYKIGMYNEKNILITSGWVQSYISTANYDDAFLAVKSDDDTEFTLTSESKLSDYVTITSNISSESKWHNKKVAFIGDSITQGINTTYDNTYHQYLNAMLGFGSMYVDGIAGSCYSSKSDYGTSKTPIVNRCSNIPTDCDLVVIFAGTNDFGHSTPLGTISDTSDVSFYGAVISCINQIITSNPDVRLAIMTPLHRSGTTHKAENVANDVGKVLKDYVNALREICEFYSIPIIDTYSIYGLNPSISTVYNNYITDGLHPNAEGHRLLAERIKPYLEIL